MDDKFEKQYKIYIMFFFQFNNYLKKNLISKKSFKSLYSILNALLVFAIQETLLLKYIFFLNLTTNSDTFFLQNLLSLACVDYTVLT